MMGKYLEYYSQLLGISEATIKMKKIKMAHYKEILYSGSSAARWASNEETVVSQQSTHANMLTG